MKLNELKPAAGSVKKNKRVGRGPGSGHGKTSCRGSKGQTARAGASIAPYFEGGQMPLVRRMPKKGFRNSLFRKKYEIINMDSLNKFQANSVVTPDSLMEAGLIKKACSLVKVLADGELKVVVTVKAHKFSKAASEQIEKAGGKAEVIA